MSKFTPEEFRMKAGDIFPTNECGDIEVTAYSGWRNVEVVFLDTGYTTSFRSDHIKTGGCKDPLSPSVYGVGFIGVGNHKSKAGKKPTKAYACWMNMMGRCYHPPIQNKVPTYAGCSVSDEWHNFQNFADFYESNFKEGMELDKDTLLQGNKVYSKETCVFITHKENSTHATARTHRFTSPSGEAVEIYNLKKFCKENGLDRSTMTQVRNGKSSIHRGWTAYEGAEHG